MHMVRFTMVDGAQEQEIFVNPETVTWVQRVRPAELPAPEDDTGSNGAGSLLHLVGQPTLPVTVTDSIDEVIAKLEQG